MSLRALSCMGQGAAATGDGVNMREDAEQAGPNGKEEAAFADTQTDEAGASAVQTFIIPLLGAF